MSDMHTAEGAQRFGFVSLVGLPNAGKSTLMNALMGVKVSIVSRKPQTTRFRLVGVRVVDHTQMAFVDTPGIFQGKKAFDRAMVQAAWDSLQDADTILYVLDARRGFCANAQQILVQLQPYAKKVCIILNKVDTCEKPQLLDIAQNLSAQGFQTIFMVSALKEKGTEDILKHLAQHLPEGLWHYPADHLTDLNDRLWAAELTREVLFDRLHQEIPFGLAVRTVAWEEKSDGALAVTQEILVSKESHRPMILGRGGQTIKAIGSQARHRMSETFRTSVHLFLHIKVDPAWSTRTQFLKEYGLA